MKFFAVVILCALAVSARALSDEEKEKVKQTAEECITSSDVNRDLIAKARAHEYSGNDDKLANYYSCLMGKLGFQKTDGTFDTDRMEEKLQGHSNHETLSQAIKKCAIHEPGASVDENAKKFVFCFYKEVGKNFKFF